MRCALEEEVELQRYRDYTAVVETNIGRLLCSYFGAEWPLPNYIEFMYPGRIKEDHQTFEDIKAHILKRLSE